MPVRDKSMRTQFRDTCISLAETDDKVVMVFGDISVWMFREFWQRWPDRFLNLGICENTLVSVAAGLSARGYFPFVHTINPFLSDRSYEQIKLDMVYNSFGGNLVTCGASFDYAWDGATHHCYTDLAMLRRLPGVEVIHPGSNSELDSLMRSQYDNGNTTYFRITHDEHGLDLPASFGKGIVIRNEGAAVTVVTAGPILFNVIEACRDLRANIIYFHTIKPFDLDLLAQYQHTHVLVVHDAYGLHEAVCELSDIKVKYHGLPDRFNCCYGELDDIRRNVGLDPAGIRVAVEERIVEAHR